MFSCEIVTISCNTIEAKLISMVNIILTCNAINPTVCVPMVTRVSLRWTAPSNEDVSEGLEKPSVGIDTPLPEDKTSIAEYSSALEIHEEAT